MVSYGDFLFAISGLDVQVPMMFNTKTNQWSWLKNLNNPGGYYCLVAEGEYLYAIGGTDGINIERIDAISEINQPGSAEWVIFSDLEIPVTHLAVVSTKE